MARAHRRAVKTGLIISAFCLLLAAPSAEAASLQEPDSQVLPPPSFRFSARQVEQLALRATSIGRAKGQTLASKAYFEFPVSRRTWVVFYGKSPHVVKVDVSDRTGRIKGVRTGLSAELEIAQGDEVVSSLWVWVPLSLLFFFAFFDPRQPFRLLHLDLLVLLSFGITKFLIRSSHDDLFLPLTYAALAYIFVRLTVAGFRPRKRSGRLAPLMPTKVIVVLLIVVTAFRVGLNLMDSRMLDVGFSGTVGASRIWEGEQLYEANSSHLDTYGPINYLAYVPFERAFPWGGLSSGGKFAGGTEDPIAGHLAAIFFDLLTIAALLMLGMRLRAGPQGRRLALLLAYAWVTLPFSAYVLGLNSNDALVSALLVFALVSIARPALRGLLLGLNLGVKFIAAPLLPVFATYGKSGRLRSSLVTTGAALTVFAFAVALYLPDGGIKEFYDTTIGYQLVRPSGFSVWGQHPSLDWLHTLAKLGLATFAIAIAFRPARKTPFQVAALAGAVIVGLQLITQHWFYFYVVWFAPFVFASLFSEYSGEVRQADDPVSAGPRRVTGTAERGWDELSSGEARPARVVVTATRQ